MRGSKTSSNSDQNGSSILRTKLNKPFLLSISASRNFKQFLGLKFSFCFLTRRKQATFEFFGSDPRRKKLVKVFSEVNKYPRCQRKVRRVRKERNPRLRERPLLVSNFLKKTSSKRPLQRLQVRTSTSMSIASKL